MHPFFRATVLASMMLLASGCSDIGELSNLSEDTTQTASYPRAQVGEAKLLSAFYGLDDALPLLASYRICGEFGLRDGMPVIFSEQVDLDTVQAGDFVVSLADGSQTQPDCVTPAPANDQGELRTVLMIGDFGSIENQPVTVRISGHVISVDHALDFNQASVAVTPLEAGPSLVFAEPVVREQWELNKSATALPFGGGNGCPANTEQIVRVVWAGGVTKPGGDEIDAVEMSAYQVSVLDDAGVERVISPFIVADLGDGDNNHKLCLETEDRAVRVEFPAGLLTDPRDDANPATSIVVSY